jgi:predicted RNA binding protein YcfA (HicA-like mRNA interferase family)
MPRLTPVSRRELIQRLQRLGFEGPYSGGRHEFMLRGVSVDSTQPHRGDISVDLLRRILRRADVSHEEWLGE